MTANKHYYYSFSNRFLIFLKRLYPANISSTVARSIFSFPNTQFLYLAAVQTGLNKGETRNALAREMFLHRLGEITDRKPENQSHRASGLTLLTASISPWNTVYMGIAAGTR